MVIFMRISWVLARLPALTFPANASKHTRKYIGINPMCTTDGNVLVTQTANSGPNLSTSSSTTDG
jgi:hypothetical protein